MKRLTTDNPTNNTEGMHNMVFIKDREVWLRGFGENGNNINLCDYFKQNDVDYADCDNDVLIEIMCDEITRPLELAYWLAVGFAEVRQKLAVYEDTGLTPEECAELAKRKSTFEQAAKKVGVKLSRDSDGCLSHKEIDEMLNDLCAGADAVYKAHLDELIKADKEGRLMVLPVPIGGSIFVIYNDTETDGTPVSGVEKLHLSGYIKEDDREFYTTYDDKGTCDVEPCDLFLTREAAKAALAEQNEIRQR